MMMLTGVVFRLKVISSVAFIAKVISSVALIVKVISSVVTVDSSDTVTTEVKSGMTLEDSSTCVMLSEVPMQESLKKGSLVKRIIELSLKQCEKEIIFLVEVIFTHAH